MKFAKKYGTKPVKINHLYKQQANKKYKLFKQATETTIEAMLYKYYLENKKVAYFSSRNLYYQKVMQFHLSHLSHFTQLSTFKLQLAPSMPRKLARKQAQCWFEKSDGARPKLENLSPQSKSDRANKQTKNSHQ